MFSPMLRSLANDTANVHKDQWPQTKDRLKGMSQQMTATGIYTGAAATFYGGMVADVYTCMNRPTRAFLLGGIPLLIGLAISYEQCKIGSNMGKFCELQEGKVTPPNQQQPPLTAEKIEVMFLQGTILSTAKETKDAIASKVDTLVKKIEGWSGPKKS